MNDIQRPGAGLIFMKVGTHAQESLEIILQRKNQEISDVGFAMWGYGGNTCHPRTMVQPFAQQYASAQIPIFLCMEEMQSKHWAEPAIADEFSEDYVTWKKIPKEINVKGSRFALKIKNLHRDSFDLALEQTEVAVGNSQGALGSNYVNGKVDKACLQVLGVTKKNEQEAKRHIRINVVAELVSPYAVFLRGNRK